MRLWGFLFGPVPAGETLGRVDRADAVVLAVFLVDYVVELALAGDRRSYVRHEWLSAIIVMTSGVALVPDLAVFGAARVLRGLPAARGIAALVRVLALGGTAARDVRGVIRRRALTFAWRWQR